MNLSNKGNDLFFNIRSTREVQSSVLLETFALNLVPFVKKYGVKLDTSKKDRIVILVPGFPFNMKQFNPFSDLKRIEISITNSEDDQVKFITIAIFANQGSAIYMSAFTLFMILFVTLNNLSNLYMGIISSIMCAFMLTYNFPISSHSLCKKLIENGTGK